MKLSSLLEHLPGIAELKGNDVTLPLTVHVDSRENPEGEGFVALRGERTDGHNFIPDVLKKGARCVFCEAEHFNPKWRDDYPGCSFVVSSVKCDELLALLAREYIEKLPSLKETVAITGSVGKTSTKNDLLALTGADFCVHCARGNYNTLIGCSVTVLSAPRDTEILLLEMGANHIGEIAEMVRYIRPTLVAVTEVAPAHLEYFKSIEGVLDAKSEIFGSERLKLAVINGDNPLLTARADALSLPAVLRFGRDGAENRVSFAHPHLSWEKNHFRVDAILTASDGISFSISLPLSGVHQLYPLCCAVALAGALGMDGRKIAPLLQHCRSSAGRGEVRISPRGAAVIDECYNASPAAMNASLVAMENADIPGRRILVLGELLELGDAAPAEHERILENASRFTDTIFLFGKSWEAVAGAKRYLFDDVDSLISAVDSLNPEEGDVVLVKGSRGNRLERVVRALEL